MFFFFLSFLLFLSTCMKVKIISTQTVGFDPIVSREDAAAFNVEKMELEQIWPVADYITVHTPLIPQTRSKCTPPTREN